MTPKSKKEKMHHPLKLFNRTFLLAEDCGPIGYLYYQKRSCLDHVSFYLCRKLGVKKSKPCDIFII